MPLIVTTTGYDSTPTRVVSLDAVLTGTADIDHGGVLLRADYSSTWGAVDNFNANTTGWSALNDSTVARTTSSPISGSGSLLWTTQQPLSTIVRNLPTFPGKPYEQKVVVYFTAKTTNANKASLSIGWAGSLMEVGILGPSPRQFFATFYITPTESISTQMVFLAEWESSTNIVLDDLTVEIQPPTGVYMFRDGKPLRGSFPAPAADGIAYGYDYEGTFGQASTWTSQPVWSIRNTEVIGPEGGGVALVVPDLAGALNMSLKSLAQPGLSRKVIGKWPAATRTWEGRNSLSANPGASLSSGSWDVPVAQAETWVMETTTRQEALDLEELLKSGPLLVQHAQINRRSDIYALVTSISLDYKRGPIHPEMLWTVAFMPIAQPTTVGAPMLIPDRTYADMANLGTYASVAASIANYDAWLTPVTVEAGVGFGVSNYGTAAFGV